MCEGCGGTCGAKTRDELMRRSRELHNKARHMLDYEANGLARDLDPDPVSCGVAERMARSGVIVATECELSEDDQKQEARVMARALHRALGGPPAAAGRLAIALVEGQSSGAYRRRKGESHVEAGKRYAKHLVKRRDRWAELSEYDARVAELADKLATPEAHERLGKAAAEARETHADQVAKRRLYADRLYVESQAL